jgi:hypothetical protein
MNMIYVDISTPTAEVEFLQGLGFDVRFYA